MTRWFAGLAVVAVLLAGAAVARAQMASPNPAATAMPTPTATPTPMSTMRP